MNGGNTGTGYIGVNYGVIQNLGDLVGNMPTTMGVPKIAGTGQSVGTSQSAIAQDAACCSETSPIFTNNPAKIRVQIQL